MPVLPPPNLQIVQEYGAVSSPPKETPLAIVTLSDGLYRFEGVELRKDLCIVLDGRYENTADQAAGYDKSGAGKAKHLLPKLYDIIRVRRLDVSWRIPVSAAEKAKWVSLEASARPSMIPRKMAPKEFPPFLPEMASLDILRLSSIELLTSPTNQELELARNPEKTEKLLIRADKTNCGECDICAVSLSASFRERLSLRSNEPAMTFKALHAIQTRNWKEERQQGIPEIDWGALASENANNDAVTAATTTNKTPTSSSTSQSDPFLRFNVSNDDDDDDKDYNFQQKVSLDNDAADDDADDEWF